MTGRGRTVVGSLAVAAAAVAVVALALALAGGAPAGPGAAAERVQAWPSSPFAGSLMPEGVHVPDVALKDAEGRTVRLARLGRPAVVTFGSAACEESCPLQAQVVRGALDQVGRDVPAFVVAVDPPRDTPRRARRFLLRQHLTGRVRFLVGPRAQLRRTWRGFAVAPQTAREHHQARIVLIDGRGLQRVGSFSSQATAESVAHDLRLLLAEERASPSGRSAAAPGSPAAGGGSGGS